MKPRQLPWKWLLLGLVPLLLLGLALVPRLFGDTSQFGERIAAELSAWTGGEVMLIGPVRVRYFPDMSVRAQFVLRGGSRLPWVKSIVAREAKISLDLVDMLRGRITVNALRLVKPKITLDDHVSPETPPGQEPQVLIANLLTGGPVRVLHVRGGTLAFRSASDTETIKDINAHFDASEGAGAVSGFGSFVFKDEAVRFSLDSGALAAAPNPPAMPVALTLTSAPVTAKINGTTSFASGLQLDGDMRAEIGDLRHFLNWVGIPLPEGQSLKRLAATGAFHVSGSTLTFDDGTFTLDGNNAVGLLAVTAAGTRPRVEGTLAFERLVVDPYLSETSAVPATGLAPTAGGLFDGALLKQFDADLRISAGEIDAGAFKFGHGGFTITAKQGVLTSEVGELELCGGSAAGRVGLDISQPATRINLVANLADIAVDSCLGQLAPQMQFKGIGGVKTEFSAEGRDMAELVRNLSGSLKVNARGGAVPVDFSRLLTAKTPLDGEGWSRNSATSFDSLNADCRLGAGHIWCQMINMQSPRETISGSGDIDLTRQTIDWSLSVANPANAVKASQLNEEDAPKVSIRGSLSQPMIRRADRPTLGEGTWQTGPIGSPVSPH
jgi:AsmA protein